MRSMKTFVTLMALFFATIMLFTGLAQAQQVIGTFPKMDGGFEGQKADTIWRYTGFKDVQTTIWTVNTGPATVYATGGRSGPKYVNYTYTAASGGRPLQSPTCDSGAIIANTLYTIQYYYRTTSDTATAAVMTACIALNGTVDGFTRIPASGGFSLAGTSNAWVKHTDSIKIISSLLPKWGLAGVRAGGAMGITLDIDDFVVYAGGVDSVAPDAPISPTTPLISGTRIQLSWTAPSTGVDSGGYMVVRGLADPSTVPTVNGIYAVGNTIAPGEQVVYLGTSTSFTDVGLNWNTQYYYRIYTVDKAFNYSSSVSVNATTKTLPSDALTNGSFGSSTGWTALLDLGGGMQATFDYNYGTVPTDGTAPGLRVVGPVTPGDWSAQVNSTIYQALSLSAANSYLLSGVIEAVKDSNSNFWLEVWLVDVEPAAGKDITLANYPNAVNLAALKQSGWGGVDNYNGPLSGCLPTPATSFKVSKSGVYYLAIKGGCGGGGIMDVLLDNLQLTKTLPADTLTNGSFGSSAGWTSLLDLGGGMQATFDYNYGTVPTGGVAPGLRVVGPVTPGDWSAQVNSSIYQAVSLSVANSYLLSGVIEAVKDSNSNFWLEVWLVDVEPAAGKDITLANYPNAVNLAALKQSGWGGVDNYNGPLSGCLPTPATSFKVSKSGVYYLAIKGGCGGGGIMDVLLDNLQLTKTLPADTLTNGSFGSSTGWTALLDLGGGMQATFDYNYGTVPTGGTAPGLRVVGPVTPGDWSAQVNSTIYQALTLNSANSYLLSGVIEAVKDSNSNFWLEVWLVDVEPAAGKDITLANYPNAVNLAALKQSGWGGVDNYNGPLSGCLPTPATAFTVSKTGTYYLAVKGGCGGGGIMDVLLDNLKLTGTLVGVKNEAASVIKTFSLQQNYPNPFNPNTKFTYQMCKTALVSIKVYDLLGREVATLVNEVKQAGSYPIEWDATRYSSGVYFYRMQTGSFVDVKKMVLLK